MSLIKFTSKLAMYKCTLKIHFDWDCLSSIDQAKCRSETEKY